MFIYDYAKNNNKLQFKLFSITNTKKIKKIKNQKLVHIDINYEYYLIKKKYILLSTKMLVRTLCRRQLTSIITYSFELPKQPVKTYFDNNYKVARENIGKISTQFNMDKSQSRRAFNFFPLIFKPQSKQFQLFKERTQWVKQYVARNDSKGIGRALQKHLFNSNYIAFQFTKEQFDKFVAAIDKYFTNQAQIDKIFTACPNLMNSKLQQILQEKVGLLTDYLSISQQEAMEVFQTTPFLLTSSLRKLKQVMLVLHRNYGLSKQQLVQQMKKMGQVFLLGGTVLIQHHRLAIRWGLTAQQAKDAFLNNPLLFFNYPENILPYKRKLFRYLNFTTAMARQMYLKYPQIFIWSIRSLQQKALFLTNRMEIDTNLKTLQLLTFNFNSTLRPRGQILIRSKTIYNQDNIVSFMKLTDEQLCTKINVPIQKLIEEKAKYPISLQMDFRKGKKLSIIGARQKFIKLASAYQH